MWRLYTYFRSSAAYRVRIALNLKGLAYEPVFVHLRRGEQEGETYRAVNPQGLVPALETEDGVIAQSLAIIEYLEETHPTPPLLPADPFARAQVRRMAQIVACDIHPLNNLAVLKTLKRDFGADEQAIGRWYAQWIHRGFAALEALVARYGSRERCFGEAVTLADVCLVPQMANARRFAVDLAPFPRLVAIDAAVRELPAFAAAAPEAQPDAE